MVTAVFGSRVLRQGARKQQKDKQTAENGEVIARHMIAVKARGIVKEAFKVCIKLKHLKEYEWKACIR